MNGLPSAVLFACTHNAVRSPMAEGLMRRLHRGRIFVQSVGVHPEEVNPFAVAVMEERGIDLSRHTARAFADLEDGYVDVIISLSPAAQHQAVEMTHTIDCAVEYWNTFDPSLVEGTREQCLEAFRKVRDSLQSRILERFPLPPPPTV